MNKKLYSTIEFVEKVKNIFPNITIIGEYKGLNHEIFVSDELNILYLCVSKQLLRGIAPSMKTAVNKTCCFISRSSYIHDYKYNYPLAKYTKNKAKVKITCPIHGVFEQDAEKHLLGQGCVKCGRIIASYKTKKNTRSFIDRSNYIHKNKYSYLNSVYVDAKEKLIITCCDHGEFYQTPNQHLNGQGCPKCSVRGWTKNEYIKLCNVRNKCPIVYIARLYNNKENFIKIGITYRDIHTRFRNIPYSYEIIKEIKGSPDFIWNKEKELHRLCRASKYMPLMSFGGETECFTLKCLDSLSQCIPVNNS